MLSPSVRPIGRPPEGDRPTTSCAHITTGFRMYASVDIPARSRSGGRRTLSFAAIVTTYRPPPRSLLSTMSKNAERNSHLLTHS